MGRKSTSMSINRPISSIKVEKKGEHDSFAAPSFTIAAALLIVKVIRLTSLALLWHTDAPSQPLWRKTKVLIIQSFKYM
jgi:hypothetical protein